MTTQPTLPRDPFEVALSRHLKAQDAPAPARLTAAVDRAVRDVVPAGRLGWARGPMLRPRRAALSFSAVATMVLVAVGGLALLDLGWSPAERPSNVAGSVAASASPSDASDAAPLSPTPTPASSPMVLSDGSIVDPAVAAGTDHLLTETGPIESSAPTPKPDSLKNARNPNIKRVAGLPEGSDPAYLVEGPRSGAYYIDQASSVVRRANLKNGKVVDIIHEGDEAHRSSKTIGAPAQLAAADGIVVVDDQGRPFRWRPSDSAGTGDLAKINLRGRSAFGMDHGDIEAYVPPVGQFRIFVAEPSLNQVMRYRQTFDGSSFDEPSAWLASASAEVADIDQIYIDLYMYTLSGDDLRRYRYGKWDGEFELGSLPDEAALRPGSDYTIVAGSGNATTMGRVYLYDAEHDRIVGFDKRDGSYIGQWSSGANGTEMDDIRGMYVIEGGLNNKRTKRRNDRLVWVTPDGIYRTTLALGG